MPRFLLAALAVTVLAAGGYVVYRGLPPATDASPSYRTAAVVRAPIASTVTAVGTLNAVVTVSVGTQVSGLVKSLHADYNSPVSAGQVIARIDPAPFEAQLRHAEAEHAVSLANVAIQQASLKALEAELEGLQAAERAARDEHQRQRSLLNTAAASTSTVNLALAARQQAESAVKAGQARLAQQRAQIELAEAQVRQAAATVQQRELELAYTRIRSPVDGVVIDRSVEAGQTVAASLQAPVLFRIAEDLGRMQVDISVDEADIGRVREGQPIVFTVDSFLQRQFRGRVHQIRKAGAQISNVVTYTVVAYADNGDGSLLPGMTAHVNLLVAARQSALLVPAAAVRLQLEPGAPVPDGGSWVWVLDGLGAPRPVAVATGITDGARVEVVDGALEPGTMVVVGLAGTAAP